MATEPQNKIYPRAAMEGIMKALGTDNIVVLHGARQVGKTSLMRLIRNGLDKKGAVTHYIDLEDSRYVRILDAGVDEFMRHLKEEGVIKTGGRRQKKVFVFIDEIQYLQEPSPFLKLIADHHKEIRLVVSGSSSFAMKSKFRDSLVGRTLDFEIFPLSFREFLNFKEMPPPPTPRAKLTGKKTGEFLALFKEYALYGGYPKIILENDIGLKEKYLQQIIDTYVKKDIRDLANVKDIGKFNKLLEALASQSGQMLDITELSNTCNIAKQTIEHYLFALENTYIIRLVRPFSRNIRSELFKTPKIYFYDTGLMQVLWLKQLQKEVLGPVFETCIFSELAKRHSRENIFYWRTKDQKEIDFILRDKNRLFPIEVKLTYEQFKPGAMEYFRSQYAVRDYAVVGLKGEPQNKFCLYPWDIP